MSDNLKETGREAINQGLADIEIYDDAKLPDTNFDIIGVLGDIIMAEFDDCSEDGTEIERDGIWVNINMTRACWRSAVVLQVGPNVSPLIEVGTRIAFPNDKGIKNIQTMEDGSKRNIIFLNEERIFGILAPKST
jgi:hypothetical protein